MSDQSPRNAATRHDDIFQTLEKCVRGTPAESYFVRKNYNQQAVEKRPDHTSDVSGIGDDQQSQSGAPEGLLQNKNKGDILSSSANTDMGNYKEREGKTPTTQQFRAGSKTERQATQEPWWRAINFDRFHISEATKQEILAEVEIYPISEGAKKLFAEGLAEAEYMKKYPDSRPSLQVRVVRDVDPNEVAKRFGPGTLIVDLPRRRTPS